MKNVKTNLLLVAALVIGGVTMSFRMALPETTWHYEGSADPNQFNIADNWTLGSAPQNTCEEQGNLPCEITVDASNESQLTNLLGGMSSQEVLDINPGSRKP